MNNIFIKMKIQNDKGEFFFFAGFVFLKKNPLTISNIIKNGVDEAVIYFIVDSSFFLKLSSKPDQLYWQAIVWLKPKLIYKTVQICSRFYCSTVEFTVVAVESTVYDTNQTVDVTAVPNLNTRILKIGIILIKPYWL